MERLIFDSHAHYDDEAFDQDRGEILRNLPAQGICRIVNVGADLQGCRDAVALAAAYPYIYAGVGIHPECVNDTPDEALNEVETLLDAPKVVAVGEIGLDYHFEDNAPREVQREWFAKQLALANRRGFSRHCPRPRRTRGHDGIAVQTPSQRGCPLLFRQRGDDARSGPTGDVHRAGRRGHVQKCARAGGGRRGGPAGPPSAGDRRALYGARPLPRKALRLLHDRQTAERIAEIRQMPVEELLKATQQNASRLFGIPLEEASV